MSNQKRFNGEWETKRLGDIASIRNQKVLSTNVDPNTPCVELEHLGSGNGQLLERATAENSTSSKYRFFAGDVLFGRLRSYLRKFWLADQDGICTTEIWPLMVDTKQLDSRFLHAIVQSDQFFAMASISYGTHMPRTDWGVMRNFPVMLPPIPEQHAIAEALSDVDGLLNALEALIAKKRAIKQATMQQLLTGKTRLPGFSGAWETKLLGEITNIQKGSLITEKSVVPGPIPVIAGGQKPAYYHNIANRTGKTITVSGSGAYAGFVALHNQPIFTSDCSTLSENFSFSIDFIYYFLVFNQDVIYKAQTGGAQPHIHPVDLMPLEVNLPELSEQEAIASVLSDMDTEITALEQHRDKTRAIKQGMMQQLLTGKVRLSESRICTDDSDDAD